MRVLRQHGLHALFSFWIAAAACGEEPRQDKVKEVAVKDYARRTIYHSPQKPGFTCWTGAWIMPDNGLMISFTQATGPVNVKDRKQAPKEVLEKLSWTPQGDARYDMTGLDLRNVHLRSTDDGTTWKQVSADPFRSPMNGVTGQAETALPDGTVVRGVWGQYLPYNPELPQTGFLQRSNDGTKSWGKPEVLLDSKKYLTTITRLRVLRDGRLIAMGGLVRIPVENKKTRLEWMAMIEPLLLVSEDGGKSWSPPIGIVPAEDRGNYTEEWDTAELPNGDLLAVFRRNADRRWQGLLKKKGKTWDAEKIGPAPLPYSGHPELLATREGVVLHIASTGMHWTSDAGASWHSLEMKSTNYYPRSVQASDGRIYIFSHVGGDDPYGATDQSITMQTFRLDVARK